MALTRGTWSAGDNSSPPDRNIKSGVGQGPQFSGNYTQNGPVSDVSGDADTQAADIYGAPGQPGDGTRMSRMKNIADVALQDTVGDGSASSFDEAFIDGGTTKGFASTGRFQGDGFGADAPDEPTVADVPGSPGFPGLPDDVNTQGMDIPTKTQGNGKGANAVGRTVNVSNPSGAGTFPAVSGSPGFPGLP
jgi:hypothetical protein